MSSKNVVLVTGGAGFLGQHVVKLLQTNADHVTEIRVLDVVPYVSKLEHGERLEVRSFTGSITDYNHVVEACKGVDSVMHIASIVDVRLFPDQQLSYNINVIGTETVIRACKAAGVKRLIYCSSMDVVMTTANIYDGNEDNTHVTADHENMFPVYGPTKAEAERLVLKANSSSLQTLSLRPAVMYGELDCRYSGQAIETALTFGRYIRMDSSGGVALHAYVGNVAWSFICADKTLLKQDNNARQASGNVYFISDDSPRQDMYTFMDPIFQEAGATPSPFAIPIWLIVYALQIVYIILLFIRVFVNVNLAYGVAPFLFLKNTYLFSYKKATQLLDYKPLFTVDESHERSVKYLKWVHEGRQGRRWDTIKSF